MTTTNQLIDILICNNCGNSLVIKKTNTLINIATPNDLLGLLKSDPDNVYKLDFNKDVLDAYIKKKICL